MNVIVVGADGSDGAAKALEFAAAEAALRETQLRIVSAWEMPDWRYIGPIAAGVTLAEVAG